MRVVVFEAEAREKPAFGRLAGHDILFVAEGLDVSNAAALGDATISNIEAFVARHQKNAVVGT